MIVEQVEKLFDILSSHRFVFVVEEGIVECFDELSLPVCIGGPYPERFVSAFFIECLDDGFVSSAEFAVDRVLNGTADDFCGNSSCIQASECEKEES